MKDELGPYQRTFNERWIGTFCGHFQKFSRLFLLKFWVRFQKVSRLFFQKIEVVFKKFQTFFKRFWGHIQKVFRLFFRKFWVRFQKVSRLFSKKTLGSIWKGFQGRFQWKVNRDPTKQFSMKGELGPYERTFNERWFGTVPKNF